MAKIYKNGNARILLMDDGTKLKMYNGVLRPMYPEMLDLKITNYCDAGCKYCHEDSKVPGDSATQYELKQILELLKGVPLPMEIAVGGGNPLDSNRIDWLLKKLKDMGHIANITINAFHFRKKEYRDELRRLQKLDLIKGIGISEPLSEHLMDFSKQFKNVVYHVIVGLTKLDYLIGDEDLKKILFLGYKTIGRGSISATKLNSMVYSPKWNRNFNELFKENNILSFDNLAISQLHLQNRMSRKNFKAYYQGEEGTISFYMDAVNMEMAKTSYSPEKKRKPITEKNFKNWQKCLN